MVTTRCSSLWAIGTASDYPTGLIRLLAQAEPRRWRLIVGFAANTTAGGHDWGTTNTALFVANGSAGLTAALTPVKKKFSVWRKRPARFSYGVADATSNSHNSRDAVVRGTSNNSVGLTNGRLFHGSH